MNRESPAQVRESRVRVRESRVRIDDQEPDPVPVN